jgi:hypothetical protein
MSDLNSKIEKTETSVHDLFDMHYALAERLALLEKDVETLKNIVVEESKPAIKQPQQFVIHEPTAPLTRNQFNAIYSICKRLKKEMPYNVETWNRQQASDWIATSGDKNGRY